MIVVDKHLNPSFILHGAKDQLHKESDKNWNHHLEEFYEHPTPPDGDGVNGDDGGCVEGSDDGGGDMDTVGDMYFQQMQR